MYSLLNDFFKRPKPFSKYTVKELWTRPHLAQQMLKAHISQDSDRASHRLEVVDQVVQWLDSRVHLAGKRVCDLGCGPGFYVQRFAERGASVVGVDFSKLAIDYAESQLPPSTESLNVSYLHADYLRDELPTNMDVVTLIYQDFCVLSPQQRSGLLGRIRGMLNPQGKIYLDVCGPKAFSARDEFSRIEPRLMNGFWSKDPYIGLQNNLLYSNELLSLDRYLIVEADSSWELFLWLQHFTEEKIIAELNAAGFSICEVVDDMPGEIGVIASVI